MGANSILLCMGTRPEIIKMAPVYYALKQDGLEPLLLHTGQHEDMADPMYRFFKILPDFSLPLQRTSDALYHLSSAGDGTCRFLPTDTRRPRGGGLTLAQPLQPVPGGEEP